MSHDYRFSQKLIHWLMAVFITLDLVVAQKFGGDMELWDRLDSRIDHASLNLVIMCLFLLRVYLRRQHGAPPAPSNMSNWQVNLSKITHLGIYILMASLFITGLITAMQATDPLPAFGIYDFTLGNRDETLFQFVRQFHEAATQLMIALIALHVMAAIYHQVVLRDQVMSRMWRSKVHKNAQLDPQ